MPIPFNLLCHEWNGGVAQFRKRFDDVLHMPWTRQLPFAGQRREVGAVRFGEDPVRWREDGGGVDPSRVRIGDGAAEGKIKT